ncbi:hypothetical protein Tco_0535848 [Tanacetum coccineum]
MTIHRLTLEFRPNPHQLNILENLLTIRLDVWNGQHVVGRKMNTVMEETYPELTLLETNSITKTLNGPRERNIDEVGGMHIFWNFMYLDLLTKDIEGFKTYEEYKDDWIYECNRDVPWVDEKPWTDTRVWTESTPVKHYYYEWYEALMDSELKEEDLRNKAIMEGLISDDKSSNNGWRIWESHEITYHDHDELECENETHDERQELYEAHELPCASDVIDFRTWLGISLETAVMSTMDLDGVTCLNCNYGVIVKVYKRRAFWSLNEDILKITILKTNTPYPLRKIRQEKTKKKNDVKARGLLLMALPNEHQLTFSQYPDAKSMFCAIETRFGGNAATKKTQKTLLKQQDEFGSNGLRWQALSLLSVRAKKYYQRTCMKIIIKVMIFLDLINSTVVLLLFLKLGLLLRECRAPRSKEGQFRNQDNTRKQGNNEDTSKAMLEQTCTIQKVHCGFVDVVNDLKTQGVIEGYSFIKKKCFVCGSLSHLIKDCDYYEKKMAREAEVKKQRVVNTDNKVAKPVWTNANRVNHANKLVPRSVQLNAGRSNINSVRPNINIGRTNVNPVRPRVNTGSSNVSTVRTRQPVHNKTSISFIPKRPQVNQFNQRGHFSKSYSSVRRPFAKTTSQIGPTFIRNVNAKGSSLKNMVDRGLFDSGNAQGHKVLFTETECLVVSPDFKMPDEKSRLLLKDAIQADCDVKATNIILQGLPPEVYALVSNHRIAKELWERIQLLMQGTSLTHQMQQMQDKAMESCMVSFRLLHSHLTALSNNDLKGTSIEGGFERAFATLFEQDVQTFTRIMFVNLDQLEKHLSKEKFQELESSSLMIRKYFIAYTKTDVPLFHDKLIQHMESLRESIQERAKHKREYDRRMNDRMMQSKEGNADSSKALDAGLVVTESNETESERHVLSSRSRKDTHAEDADINSVNDKQPMAEVQLTAEHNILANEQQHYEQSESIYDTYLLEKVDRNTTPDSTDMSHRGGEIDQNAVKCQVSCPLLDPSFDTMTTEFSNQSLEESVLAKPHHVIAPGSSRNSQEESYGSNDMAYNHYLEEARKKTQERNRNSKSSVMHTTSLQNTTNDSKQKPRSNNQTSRSLPVSKSSGVMSNSVPLVDHSRNSSSFSDSKHFVCSTCQKCVFNANHDACLKKFLKEVNSRVKVQSPKTRNSNKPIEPKIHTQKPGRQIVTGHRFSPNKSFAMLEKTTTPRSCLRWIPTGRICNTVGLRWVPTGKIFTSSTTKVDCEPPNGLNEDITNPYECDQTLNVSACTLNLSAVNNKARGRTWLCHSPEYGWSNLRIREDRPVIRSPTTAGYDVALRRIYIFIVRTYVSLGCSAIPTRIMRRNS